MNKRAKGANKKKCPVTGKGGRGVKPLFITLESRGTTFLNEMRPGADSGRGRGQPPPPDF